MNPASSINLRHAIGAVPLPEAPAASEPETAAAAKFGFDRLYTLRLYQIYYAIEKLCGPAVVPFLTLPFALVDILRRRRDYAQFVRVRGALPGKLWKGTGSLRHYLRMIFNWQETLIVCLLYTRLGEAYWKRRITIKGTPPQDLPEWGKRPVILAFMHTGYFGMIRFFMRSQGVPTASLIAAMPTIVDNPNYNKYLEAGDKQYGVEGTPHYFQGPSAIREAMRYLKPGRALTMALDGGVISPESEWPKAGNLPVDVKRGACRVGAQVGAMVVPISVRRTGWCRYQVRFGQPVPNELLEKGDFAAGAQHLVSELWPDVEANPLDLNWTSMEAFHPGLIAPRYEWP